MTLAQTLSGLSDMASLGYHTRRHLTSRPTSDMIWGRTSKEMGQRIDMNILEERFKKEDTTKNRFSSILDEDEYNELSRRVGYTRFKGNCPTCRGTKRFIYKGEDRACEEDSDGVHIQFKLFQRYELANIPQHYQRLDWNDFTKQSEARLTVDDYIAMADNAIDRGVGMYVYSNGLGTGKTFVATHILKEFVKRGHKGYYVPFFDILDLYEREDGEKKFIQSKLKNAPLVVIDDVIAPKVSEKQANFFRDTLERTVRHRQQNGLPTIITSNLTIHELEVCYDRIFSLAANSMIKLKLDDIEDTRIQIGINYRMLDMLNGETPPIT